MTNPQTGQAIDVRRIVLDVIEGNAEAAQAYLLDPAMQHGVEVTVGVLGRTAAVLNSRGHTRAEVTDLIQEIAVACSHSGGPEYETVIGVANQLLHRAQEWTAVLAPLGIPSEDDRALATTFTREPTTFPLPLREDTVRARIIGTVTWWEVQDGQLIAKGLVDDPNAAALMRSGVLRPQMELALCDIGDGPIAAASLREVRAGRQAVWEVCRFTINPPE